jgi:hypothetical protein
VSRRHSSRGQILPVWIVAILTILILTFMAINYGNTLRWQMRAQNAADAAAQAVMAIQTQHFNELSAALYATNVEEFRIRLLLDGMLNALNGAGGCTGAPPVPKAKGQALFLTGSGTCDQVFNTLLPYYEEAVVRYGADVAQLNNVATLTTFSNWSADSSSLLAHISSSSHCNTVSTTTVVSDGGDCQFQYTLNGIGYRRGLNALEADAYNVVFPALGDTLANNAETENAQLFDPGMVDIVTCAKVPPLIPIFAALQGGTHYVRGRAGATAVLAENDWLQPGAIVDPARSGSIPFQPYENYTSADSGLSYDWYGVWFGGSAWFTGTSTSPSGVVYPDYGSTVTENELDAYAGWWTAIPYDPRLVVPGASPPTIAADCPA